MGTASIDVNLGNDRFYFSVDKPLKKHAGSPTQFHHERFQPKKKSPSDLRRNSRRLKEFLEKKAKNMKGTQIPTKANHSSSPVPKNSMETADLSLISEAPMTEDEGIDYKSSDNKANASCEQISSVKVTRNNDDCEQIPENKTASGCSSSARVQTSSPIIPPAKEKQNKIPEKKEIIITLCGPDISTIKKNLPDFKYIRQVEESKKHFMFGALAPSSFIPELKKNIKKFVKLPKNIFIVSFYINKENEVYKPGEEEHPCPCQK